MARKAVAAAATKPTAQVTKWPDWVQSAETGFKLKAKKAFEAKHPELGKVRFTPFMDLEFVQAPEGSDPPEGGLIRVSFKWGEGCHAADLDPNLLEPRPVPQEKPIEEQGPPF